MPTKRTFNFVLRFIQRESFGGILLFVTAILALLIANSPWQAWYHALTLSSVALWINDGLMTLFFVIVGLEIKREFLEGELSTPAMRYLPGMAALGGMLIPAFIYAAINWNDPAALRGWAIPTATDIAFALGCLSLLGNRVPLGLKVFLAALAIADDLGAILIIAIFYTQQLNHFYLALAATSWSLLVLLNRAKIASSYVYIAFGFILWLCTLRSGIHPTIAGVLLALTIPLQSSNGSMLRRWESTLHPWTAYAILPLFAFVNAGVSFSGVELSSISSGIPLGIIAGLVIGKQFGVFTAAWLAVKLHWAELPAGVNWRAVYGIAMLSGIGFTMSLFIGNLAFAGQAIELMNQTRIGVLLASLLAGGGGYFLLCYGSNK